MPLVEAAWLGGAISDPHAAMLAKAQSKAPKAFDRDQEQLVGDAIGERFSSFTRLLAYWMQCADPDGTEDDANEAHDARRLHLSQSFNNMWFLDGAFDSINGEILSKVLGDFDRESFESDWAEAKARVGNDVMVSDLRRTPAQRRADAMVEMARRAAAMPPGSRLPAPLFTAWSTMRPRRGASSSWHRAPSSAPARWSAGSTRPTSSESCSVAAIG